MMAKIQIKNYPRMMAKIQMKTYPRRMMAEQYPSKAMSRYHVSRCAG